MRTAVTFIIALAAGCASITRKPSSLTNIVLPANQQDITACDSFQKALPAELKRGYITTQEKDGSSQREVKIFYYGKWKSKPLVIANGGPGGSSWSTYRALNSALERENIEYLFFDQRGTGCSSSYPQLDETHFPEWMNYGSKGLASDIELLRKNLKLGKQISVFGHSFGSKIALRYAIDYPKSTRSILFFGDSYVASEADFDKEMVSTLKRQQDFLNRRLKANTKLQPTLQLLENKFKSAPCASDAKNLISACGYDLVRDLGHYYTDSSAEQIEGLLFKLADPQTEELAFREIVLKYTRWKIDPTTLLLGFMDYRHIIEGKLVCDRALELIEIPSWALNSCAMSKYRMDFLRKISTFIQPQLITSDLIFSTLKTHPKLRAYALSSPGDLNSGGVTRVDHPRNWIAIELSGVDHKSYLESKKFWEVVRSAL